MTKIFNLTNITLLVALALSTVAAYYSIIGLTAIFAGAVIPIIIMGSILEIGKITTTVWLRKYWKQCSLILKLYLVPAVVMLAILTSMGIFGFLSKAHTDSGLISGDVQAKLALFDEKIKTERDNIEVARKALQQMDAQVDARLSRGDSEQGAERAVQIRRQQQGERQKLLREINDAQSRITKLNEERAPIAAENRKVEAEVGPIKYVAALIYGDNPDANLLERAVRWVIILLVIVFDPLAIALVLAANSSKEWDKKVKEVKHNDIQSDPIVPNPNVPLREEVIPSPENEILITPVKEPEPELELKLVEIEKPEPPKDDYNINELTHPYLYKTGGGFKNLKPVVYIEEKKDIESQVEENEQNIEPISEEKKDIGPAIEEKEQSIEPQIEMPQVDHPVVIDTSDNKLQVQDEEYSKDNKEISEQELESTNEIQHHQPTPIKELDGGYILYDGKSISKDALKGIKPELFKITADSYIPISTKFGTTFPRFANKGDMFIRVDVLPNRLFKFDGRRWFEMNKDTIDSYLDEDYIRFLIGKISSGEYDLENLSDKEKDEIEAYLKSQNQ